MTRSSRSAVLLFFAVTASAWFARAQDNYEIQVYGVDTVAPRSTMVEIHSNFTVDGSKTVQDGMLPTNHAEHETPHEASAKSEKQVGEETVTRAVHDLPGKESGENPNDDRDEHGRPQQYEFSN